MLRDADSDAPAPRSPSDSAPADGPPLSAGSALKGIAIVGSHPETVMEAPFDDERWLIYACSPHNFEHRQLPRIDAWFEVHKPVADQTRAYPYLKYVETLPLVWMRDKDALPYIKGAREYPEAEMRKLFCPFMFTSSIALMLAKAIVDAEEMGVESIGVWGVHQAAPNEYVYQRPGIQYFLWEATQRKIRVMAPEASKLFELPQERF